MISNKPGWVTEASGPRAKGVRIKVQMQAYRPELRLQHNVSYKSDSWTTLIMSIITDCLLLAVVSPCIHDIWPRRMSVIAIG